ncbi:putative catabolite repression protein creC [Morella rubra]|uniref:Putative catabolite repression protein creC n=1 Tax=Morella rubra TaxID=262757 RepID=A0A6A1WF01_9ROSI|nr:putative catabolite repression protein creC [Morella rubra]
MSGWPVTLAHLKDKPASSTPPAPPSSFSASSGVRSAAARLLGGSNGSRAHSFVGGNGVSKSITGNSRIGSLGPSSSSTSLAATNFDGKGTYLVFNVGDAIFISDLNSQDKDPIKSMHFGNSNPVCHAFDQDAKDGHDLLIGLSSGDADSEVSMNNSTSVESKSRCTSIVWVPGGDGAFVVAHADGNLAKMVQAIPHSLVLEIRCNFLLLMHVTSNPVARWHICHGSINNIAFSRDGAFLATVGRDGYLRVFDYSKEHLICGGKSYYGALLCCAWRLVSGVAFDSYWSSPNSEGTAETVMYRFGSVGQDTQLLLWDLEMDEIVVPLRRYPPGGSPTYSTGSQSSHWDNAGPVAALQPAPSMRDVPKISPLAAHRVHNEPLSGLIFTQESVLTVSRDGHIKIWIRPGIADSQSNNTETVSSTSLKEKPLFSSKVGSSSYKL